MLLPGMHGTGALFSSFIAAIRDFMPGMERVEALDYSTHATASYENLLSTVQAAVPQSEPFFLLAESYSTPLAIELAATKPANLKGLILCAGFASSPLTGIRRLVATCLAPVVFRLPVPHTTIQNLLLGPGAPSSVQADVRCAISSVKPDVLTSRLRMVLSCDARSALSRVDLPILYLRATQDRLVPESAMQEIKRIQPAARVEEIAAPHLILQREPIRAAEIIAKFIGEADEPQCRLSPAPTP